MNRNSTNSRTTRILAEGVTVSNDTWATQLNNNDLIIGPTGAGKTRGYVKPNLLQANESVIVTDTKGNLVYEVGPFLRREGYRVLHLDFTNLRGAFSAGPVRAGHDADSADRTGHDAGPVSIGYNPFDFVRRDPKTGDCSEQDVMRIADILCPMEDPTQPFWDYAAKMVLSSLIAYVLTALPEEQHTLEYVLELVSELQTGLVDELMTELSDRRPNCMAVRKYRAYRSTQKAEKMFASICGILAEKLDPVSFDGALEMLVKPERICFREIGSAKTAVFLTVSDTDRSMDKLVTLFYTQAMQELCSFADHCPGSALPVPVRLYLDDFATNCRIPDFDNLISVIRSRGIAVSVILQNLTQLESLYGQAKAMTIAGNCDHIVYLGGQDPATARYIATLATRTVDTIMRLPVGRICVFERGQRARMAQVYDLKSHARYPELAGAGAGEYNTFEPAT